MSINNRVMNRLLVIEEERINFCGDSNTKSPCVKPQQPLD